MKCIALYFPAAASSIINIDMALVRLLLKENGLEMTRHFFFSYPLFHFVYKTGENELEPRALKVDEGAVE